MRVLMITQKLDPSDQVLAFTHDWVLALAQRVDQLDVLCLELRSTAPLPENVRVWSMGKERGIGRIGELRQFYAALNQIVPRVDVIFVHMIPRYVLLAAPVAARFGVPIGLWYTHPHKGIELRLATRLVRWIATASPTSFPLRTPKVHALNHGINARRFVPGGAPKSDPPLIISVGRLSPIKHHETLIEAAALLRDTYGDPACRFAIVGAEVATSPPDYRASLIARRDGLHLTPERFAFLGALTPDALVPILQAASLSVNLMPVGAFDKAALEAMLCGLPLLAVSPDFAPIFGEYAIQLQLTNSTDASDLARRLNALLQLDRAELGRIGDTLRQRTAALHSLDSLMDRLVALMQTSIMRS